VQQATDLLDLVTWPSTECVNASSDHPLENALKQVCYCRSAHASCRSSELRSNVACTDQELATRAACTHYAICEDTLLTS
jgi:hypothetical protein